jgi:glycosyltransferase involved in cell wall biosynthesis
MIASQVSGIPWSSTAHRWDIYERNAFDVKQSSVAFVRAISARGAADIRSRMPVLEDRVVHIPLGAQVPPARPASRMRGGRFTIVCPASLVPVKGHADLLMALAKLRDAGVGFRCLMCGSGPLASALEQRAAALYLSEFVQFKGYVPQTTLHEWYCSGTVDAVVLASQAAGEKAMEGIPCALIEAMAFRIPVVATNSGSVAELVDDDCGRLVPPGDTDAFAEALLDVAVYPAGARARAERAYAKVQRCHDVRVQMRLLATALGA